MCEDNQTDVTVFILLGFKGLYSYKILFFILFLFSYILVITGNLILVVLVSISEHLKIPMFIFLRQLAVADILITTTIIPMMLDIILRDTKEVFVTGCLIQIYIFDIFESVQCFLIAVMSYDRCLAICNPMRYNSIMSPDVCRKMIAASWLLACMLSIEIIVVCQLQFCGLNYIDHFFCDFGPIVELATSDTSTLLLVDMILSFVVFFIPFSFIIITYIIIFYTISKISLNSGRKKAFSTCSSHLATVFTYYGTLMIIYMGPSGDSSYVQNKLYSLLYIVVTPMMNPIIYSLRSREVRQTLHQVINIQTQRQL
ncbi:olfactory receptor 11A1-like [Pseudophryne corroboree]|uniref:olfactory receptor 11A1-like n=1 Tax=Pseudophryne corroboree TaxID=495146 RepID=UPI00308147C7